MSYDGHLYFGMLADWDAMPDLEALRGDLEWAIGALRRAAGPKRGPANGRRSTAASATTRSPART